MRRFLQHVLPKGLHKVRYFGLWHPSRREQVARMRQLLLLDRPYQSFPDEGVLFEADSIQYGALAIVGMKHVGAIETVGSRERL